MYYRRGCFILLVVVPSLAPAADGLILGPSPPPPQNIRVIVDRNPARHTAEILKATTQFRLLWIAATIDCNSGNRWLRSGPPAQFSSQCSGIRWQASAVS